MLFERMSGSFGLDAVGVGWRVVVVGVVGMSGACWERTEDWRSVGGMNASVACVAAEVSSSASRRDVECSARMRTGSCICLDCAGLGLSIDESRACEEICRAF